MNLEDRVLEWVNEVRADLGLPPRKKMTSGKPKDTLSCPVARSISTNNRSVNASVWQDAADIFDRRDANTTVHQTVPLPGFVQHWIRLFDYGKWNPGTYREEGPEDDS